MAESAVTSAESNTNNDRSIQLGIKSNRESRGESNSNPNASVVTPKATPTNYFWDVLEKENKVSIPSYVKNICRLSNLDKPATFKNITDETIKELENFARTSMYVMLDASDNLESFYGSFYKVPDKFCL